MSITTEQQLQERFEQLPGEIASLLTSTSTENKVREICLRYGLAEIQIDVAQALVARVLLGEEHVDDLDLTLQEYAGIDTTDAEYIADEIRQKIFGRVIGDIRDIDNEFKKFEPEQAPPEVPAGQPSTQASVLQGIEHPEPSSLTKEIGADHHEDPFPMVIKSEPPANLPVANQPAPAQPTPKPELKNFLDSKLSGTVRVESKTETLTPRPQPPQQPSGQPPQSAQPSQSPQPPQQQPQPRKYDGADPYREAL